MAATHPATTRLAGFQQRALMIGAPLLLATLAGVFISREHFFRAWLVGYMFWAGIGLGCMGILLLHGVTGGNWGVGVRRLLESGARTMPLMALFFIPIAFGLKDLYIWARPEVVAADPLLQHKAVYLNAPFLLARTVVYFAVWIFVALKITGMSLEQDRTGSPAQARRLRQLSGPGIILYMLTMTFASVDWIMSLEPHWFSTIYGALFVIGQVLSAFAFIIPLAVALGSRKPMSDVVSKDSIYDLGNLLMAFVLIWAYLAFSQFLIIWAGNLPEEIPWYLRRLSGGWQLVGLAVILLHFALPFLMLIARATKRNARVLSGVALLVLFMRLVELFWVISPAAEAADVFRVHWLDIAAPIGIGGIWMAVFLNQLKRRWDVTPGDRHSYEVNGHGQ